MTDYLKKFRNYCYDQDYNFYHNTYKKLIVITRSEYKKKTGETDYIINKLLSTRVWSSQNHNYFFYKIDGKDVPIDWKLINILKYFHKNKFETSQLDQGVKDSQPASIRFKNNENLENFLKNKLGEENIIIIDFDYEIEYKEFKEYIKKESAKKFILVNQTFNFSRGKIKYPVLYWNDTLYTKINKLLKIKIPDIKKSHDGCRVIPKFILQKVKHLIE